MREPMVDSAVESRIGGSSDLSSRWPLRSRAVLEIVAAFIALTLTGLSAGWLILGPLGGSALAEWDREVAVWLAARRDPTLDTLTDIGSAFSNTENIVIGLLVLMVAMVLVWRRWRESLTLGVALGLEASVFLAVSTIVGRDRPPVEQLDPSPPTASFPSGHTGAAFAFYIGLAFIVFWTTRKRLPRAIGVAGATLVPVAVAVSRMYRGMHFMTDVVIGAALGAASVLIAIVIVHRAVGRMRAKT
ncbi:MAG TPA: phosphatase PAP2 family protein [Acidimicrobiia bacterium]